MNKIIKKKNLTSTTTLMEVEAPLIAKKARAGQFIILRVNAEGERIPLTIANTNLEKGTVTIIFQIIGATTALLNNLQENDYINDFVGPLGIPTETAGIKKAIVVGGGVGCAIAFPLVKELSRGGALVDTIVGFRSRDLVILEEELQQESNRLLIMTDDGSYHEKGKVTDALKKLLDTCNDYDIVYAIGPLIMMKFVCLLTKEYHLKTIVSMNPIMIDGTGMCGCCRLSVGGITKFACVDGPDFDGHAVDFDEAIDRTKLYLEFERNAREKTCHLLKE